MNTTNFTILVNQSETYESPQVLCSVEEFFTCYNYFINKNLFKSIFGIFTFSMAAVLNFTVIGMLALRQASSTIFDKILIGLCFVDGLVAVIDIPIFHVMDIFGYNPFGYGLTFSWSLFDNSINTITNLHMLYLSWAQYRSINSPMNFKGELLFRKPYLMMLFIWVFSMISWLPFVLLFGIVEFTTNVNYQPYFIGNIINLFLWLIPLILILILTILVIRALSMRKFKSKKFINYNSSKKTTVLHNKDKVSLRMRLVSLKRFIPQKLSPEVKLLIIMISYLLQWFLPSTLTIFNGILFDAPVNVSFGIYWLTYTVCLTHPAIMLVSNSNISRKNKVKHYK